ncbi:MAG: O-antigen ligase family protein [Kiritimatiellaeota bacterium]|nr:O-antigen ligase family protein [Kiritimatiellota bacterium]
MTPQRIRCRLESGVRGATVLLLFLAPLKFGNIVGNGEISLFPLSGIEWIFGPWPPFLLAVLAGLLLAAAALVFPPPPVSGWAWSVPGVWLLLALGACIGLWRTTEWEYALLFVGHILGATCLALSCFWIFPWTGRWRSVALAAVAAGVLWAGADGWAQVPGGGLRRFAESIERQAKARGTRLSPGMASRLHQTRAFATFTYPNSFAAHLLLTAPIALLLLWRAGGRFEPVRVSRRLFLGAGLVLLGGALWFTGSRAAVLALGGAIAVGALYQPRLRRFRGPIVLGALVAALLAGTVLTLERSGRKLSSIESRLGYYRAALVMFREHPVAGVGLGEFFPNYLRLKSAEAEETRQPHNMFLAFLAQAGILGGVFAGLCLALPLYLPALFRRAALRCDPGLLTAVQVGLAGWCLHALTDFNVQIPGTVATAAVLPVLCITGLGPGAAPDAGASGRTAGLLARCAALLLALAAAAGLGRIPGEADYARLAAAATGPDVSMEVVKDLAVRAGEGLPFSPYPWTTFGRIARARGDWGLVARAYREAVLRAPHRAAFHRHFAEALLEIGEKNEARRQFRLAREWYPTDPKNQSLAQRLGLDERSNCPTVRERL